MSETHAASPTGNENPPIETPQITAPKIEKPEIKAPGPAVDEVAARAPVPNPEADQVVPNPVHIPTVQHDAPVVQLTTAVPQITTVSTETPHAPLVVMPQVFKQAEINLAGFIGQKISPELTKGLVLTLRNDVDFSNRDATTVSLTFSGPMVAPNVAELHKEVMLALQTHPVLGPLFTQHATNSAMMGSETVLNLNMHNVPTEQYVKLIQSLATPPAVTLSPLPHKDLAEEASKKEQAPQPDQAVNVATTLAPAETAEAVKIEHTEKKPQPDAGINAASTVETPVIKMGPLKEQEQQRVQSA